MSEFNKVYVYKLLKDKGFSENAIAGIMGNIEVETGGSFDYQQAQEGGRGYGLFQFDPTGKMPAYNGWLQAYERKDSPEAQVDFMHDTIYKGMQVKNKEGKLVDLVGEGHREKLITAFEEGDAASISDAFTNRWEIPKKGSEHYDRRRTFATSFNPDGLPHVGTAAVAELVSPYIEKGMDWLKQGEEHMVQSGDNVHAIAKKYGMSQEELQALNPEYDIAANKIFVDKPLKVGQSWYDKIDGFF